MPAISLSPVVELDGQPLEDSWAEALSEIRVECEYQVPGRATLRFLEHDGVGGPAPLIDDQRLKLGLAVVVQARNPTAGSESDVVLFNGEITAIGVSLASGAAGELVVTAHDRSHRMGRTTNVATFSEVMLSDVVSGLAAASSLTADVQTSREVYKWVLQSDSDLGMLTEIARRTGYDWWVTGTTLHFAKPAEGPTVTATLYDNLVAFTMRASGHHPDRVNVRGWDRTQKTSILGTSTTASTAVVPTSGLAESVRSGTASYGAPATLVSSALAPTSQTEAEMVSQAVLDRAVSSAVTVRGTCIDTPTIAVATSVTVQGAGPRLDGSYPVTRVEHVFRSGTPLTTRFSAGDRTSHSLVETLGAGAGTRSPAFRHDGLVVGIVTNNNDPDKLGRIKVKIPGLDEEHETWWARVVTAGGGSARGNAFHPEVNDEVLVGFEGGDPRQPVVLGGLFSSPDKPPLLKFDNGGKVAERTITSRRGHVFSIVEGDDDADQAAFLLKLATDAGTLSLAGKGANLEVPDGKPITIKAGSAKIAIAADGSITIDSPANLTLKAQGNVEISGAQVKISAETTLALQGEAQATLKGAMVEVNASAMAAVKGGLVQIN